MLTTSKLAIDNKRFVANVAEAAEPIITGAIKASERKTAVLADMGVVRQVVTTKADKAEVASVAEHLDAKADKTELKRIEFKADRSVVERLAEEMKSQDGEHTQCLNDLATGHHVQSQPGRCGQAQRSFASDTLQSALVGTAHE